MSHQTLDSELSRYLNESIKAINSLDLTKVDSLIDILENLRKSSGKLVIAGLGGSAANASHLVNDFRKLCRINAFSPTDNLPEYSARVNDEDGRFIFNDWIQTLGFTKGDALLILSVGGGSRLPSVSESLIELALEAKKLGGKVFGIFGREGGEITKFADLSIVLNLTGQAAVLQTPISESLQLLIGHSIVFSSKLKITKSKW